MLTRFAPFCVLVAGVICSYGQQAGADELTKAYQSLAQKDYDSAIAQFRKALAQQAGNAGVHKDLAYTLLKTGGNADARDEFESALKLNPNDETAALEYAFLCFETKKQIEARRTFDRLRHRGSATTRATAEQAFQNIDRPLADGIARWKQALARAANPNELPIFSAHWELAQLAEFRDELPLAAEQYEICRKLKPNVEELLLNLARVWQQLNRVDEARSALVAASRCRESRTAELALDELGSRYPYPYEFVNAIKLDPQNVGLRRELAFLYLAMHQEREAMEQFEQVLAIEPKDELSREQLDALRGVKKRPQASVSPASSGATPANGTDPRSMGMKSLAAGYIPDAIKYLQRAHNDDPGDAEVTLKLGWAYNAAKRDDDARQSFDEARHADDNGIAAQASKAFHTLNGDPVAQTTVWVLPMFSTRWKDAFTYGQMKRTVPLAWLGRANKLMSFYASIRFDGDVRSGLPVAVAPTYLSENAFILGAGVSSRTWHHVTAWAEAGEALSYLPGRRDVGTAIPDYRGGINVTKGFGSLLGGHTQGYFYETTADGVYVSRFNKDTLVYLQQRGGRTFRTWGNTFAQALFNVNVTQDFKRQYWADTIEMGPGVKLHMPWMPPNVYLSTDFLRGVYTNNISNPRRPNYYDVRISLWYAITK
ncbi:MAG: tetratricopeptide repeat protein [Bryobacteraceae bacterium]